MTKLKQYQLNLKLFVSLFWVTSLVLCGSTTHIYAGTIKSSDILQSRTITGKVTSSDDNMGIPGVSVLVKGTVNGAVTDFDGNYTIKVPASATLIFSYIGFVTQKITVANQTTINATLEIDSTTLDEVVVVGYGTQKKEVITGAIDVVKSEAFEDRAITSPLLALQGVSPSLIVTRNSSRPGDNGADFRIRGNTSINGGSALIVVDGVPGADFALINPDDIESISILKDGSAAIYGAQGANGVVLVTTKKGKGKMSIDFSSQVRINTLGIKPPNTSALDYFNVYIDAMESDEAVLGLAQYNAFGWLSLDNAKSIRDMFARGEEGYINSFWGDPAGNPTDIYATNNNIWEEVYGTSVSQQHNFSISGSEDKIDYRFSALYSEDIGPVDVAYDGQIRYNIRSVVNVKVNDRLKFGSNISFNHNKISQPSATLSGTVFTNDPSIYPTVNPYGQWVSNFNYSGGARQPLADLVDGGRNNEERDRLNMTFDATYKITDHLDLQGTASFIINNVSQTEYKLEVPIYSFDGLQTTSILRANNSSFETRLNTGRRNTYGAYLNYKNTFNNDHNFALTTGINTIENRNKTLEGERTGFEDQGIYNIGSAQTDVLVQNSGTDTHEGQYGIIANATYDYKNKYLVNAIFRRDGSSRFDEGFKWDNFVGGSLGWVLTKEKFMENIDFLDHFKIRASYGETANGPVGINRYDYVSQLSTSNVLFGDTPSQQSSASLGTSLTSNVRTWERVEQGNIGLDLGFFNNRLTGTFDIFKKTNVGMFVPIPFPFALGGNAPTTNNGNLEAKGWEADITWKDKVNEDFRYSVNFFMSDVKDKIVDIDGFFLPTSGVSRSVEGHSISSLWVYKTDGVFQDQAEVDSYYAAHTSIQNNAGNTLDANGVATKLSPGDIRKVDVNKDGKIDQTDVINVGDVSPHFNFGINLSANYKAFDIKALFQGTGQQQVVRTGAFAYPIVGRFTNQTDQFLGQTWTPTNTDAAYPRTTTHTARSNWNWAGNDFMVQNSQYVRLKSIVIGYTLPKFKINGLELDKVRIYFSGNDLWELSSLDDGYDPEFGGNTTNTYPFTRTWAFGINVNL